jgi:hypothetical protein
LCGATATFTDLKAKAKRDSALQNRAMERSTSLHRLTRSQETKAEDKAPVSNRKLKYGGRFLLSPSVHAPYQTILETGRLFCIIQAAIKIGKGTRGISRDVNKYLGYTGG